jgi:hypothetical protein
MSADAIDPDDPLPGDPASGLAADDEQDLTDGDPGGGDDPDEDDLAHSLVRGLRQSGAQGQAGAGDGLTAVATARAKRLNHDEGLVGGKGRWFGLDEHTSALSAESPFAARSAKATGLSFHPCGG